MAAAGAQAASRVAGVVVFVSADLDKLNIVHYPDPRLRQVCETIREFDGKLAALANRMLEVMRAGGGVGLAAPQVGVLKRVFVMNRTGEPGDEMVFVNPELHDAQGSREAEEGCLCLPEIYAQIRRAARCRIVAQGLNGDPIELEGEDLIARIWQHETDHLNGILILDRMGPSDKIAAKKKLKELEAAYKTKARR